MKNGTIRFTTTVIWWTRPTQYERQVSSMTLSFIHGTEMPDTRYFFGLDQNNLLSRHSVLGPQTRDEMAIKANYPICSFVETTEGRGHRGTKQSMTGHKSEPGVLLTLTNAGVVMPNTANTEGGACNTLTTISEVPSWYLIFILNVIKLKENTAGCRGASL